LPQILPLLVLLLLFLPRQNRSVRALWIGVPVALILAVAAIVCAMPGVESEPPEAIFEMLATFAFELGAVWLLSPYLKRQGRFLTFLGMLVTMELVGALVFVAARSWSDGNVPIEMLGGMALCGLLLSIAINLAGWSCRGRFARLRLSLWSFLWLVAGWLACLVVIALVEGPGTVLEMALGLLMLSGVTYALLLPFLILSFTNGFYRQRLKEVLRLEDPAPAEPEKH
jgi:hypothetical protein